MKGVIIMKCQNCGKNEVSFHYSSNVNGCVTQTHLCSECAAKSGLDIESIFGAGGFFGDESPFGMRNAFLPVPIFGFGMAPLFAPMLQTGLQPSECECGGACEAPVPETPQVDVDAEMLKRREINILREQMRLAADKDDFEKAAELRDEIKRMEAE